MHSSCTELEADGLVYMEWKGDVEIKFNLKKSLKVMKYCIGPQIQGGSGVRLEVQGAAFCFPAHT